MAGARRPPYLLFASALAVVLAAIVLGLVVMLLAGDSLPAWLPRLSLRDIEEAIQSAGPWGVAVAIGLMVLHCFVPFPAELVAIANGMVYGPVWGTAVTWSGAMLGAMLSFALARVLGRSAVRRLLDDASLQSVDRWVERNGAGAVFVGRFIPVLSFNLINYAAGLAGISWWTFAWATGVGILPMTTLMVVLGDRIETMPWYAWPLLLLGGTLLWLVVHRRRRPAGAGGGNAPAACPSDGRA